MFDHQAFSYQTYGGVSRYFAELSHHLRNFPELGSRFSGCFSNNAYLGIAAQEHFRSFLPGIDFRGKVRLQGYLNRKLSEREFAKSDFDIFHPTYYDPYILNLVHSKPYVLTIYDMIHELFPESLHNAAEISHHKVALAKQATALIAISEQTKADAIRILNIDPAKIRVTYLASSLRRVQAPTHLVLPERFILFVGSRDSYKNFDVFIRAITSLLKQRRGLHLVCAGGGAFSKAEEALMRQLGVVDQVSAISVDDVILATLYAKAAVFVFPSLYEGFGIPIIEAFNCRCPVAASAASSLPEVAGDAAIYFDPRSPQTIVDAVQEILDHPALAEELVAKGVERAKDFTWEKTAKTTANLYKSIL